MDKKLEIARQALERISRMDRETPEDLEGAAEGHLRPLSRTMEIIARRALGEMDREGS